MGTITYSVKLSSEPKVAFGSLQIAEKFSLRVLVTCLTVYKNATWLQNLVQGEGPAFLKCNNISKSNTRGFLISFLPDFKLLKER